VTGLVADVERLLPSSAWRPQARSYDFSTVNIFFGSTAAMLMNQVRAIARQREYRSGIVSVSCMIDCALGHGERHPFYDGVCQIIVES
jgi:hypothetical protein